MLQRAVDMIPEKGSRWYRNGAVWLVISVGQDRGHRTMVRVRKTSPVLADRTVLWPLDADRYQPGFCNSFRQADGQP